MTNINNNKFIFKYEPRASIKDMFAKFREAIESGKEYIQPENVSLTDNLGVIDRILSKTRLEIFAIIRAKHPENIQELAQLVNRDYANVWRDCQVLASCKIIELKKEEVGTKPIALYDQIVIEFPDLKIKKEPVANKAFVY